MATNQARHDVRAKQGSATLAAHERAKTRKRETAHLTRKRRDYAGDQSRNTRLQSRRRLHDPGATADDAASGERRNNSPEHHARCGWRSRARALSRGC